MIAILLAAQLAAAQAAPAPKGPTPQQRFAAVRAQCLGFLPFAPEDLLPGVECLAREDKDVLAGMALDPAKTAAVEAAYARMRQAAADPDPDQATKTLIAIDDEMLKALGTSVERLGEPEFLPQELDAVSAYPVQARLTGVNGFAVVKCWVDAQGAMQRCKLTAVGPPDVGFEEAGPRLGGMRKIKPVVLNRARIGDVPVTFPVEFRLFD